MESRAHTGEGGNEHGDGVFHAKNVKGTKKTVTTTTHCGSTHARYGPTKFKSWPFALAFLRFLGVQKVRERKRDGWNRARRIVGSHLACGPRSAFVRRVAPRVRTVSSGLQRCGTPTSGGPPFQYEIDPFFTRRPKKGAKKTKSIKVLCEAGVRSHLACAPRSRLATGRRADERRPYTTRSLSPVHKHASWPPI